MAKINMDHRDVAHIVMRAFENPTLTSAWREEFIIELFESCFDAGFEAGIKSLEQVTVVNTDVKVEST